VPESWTGRAGRCWPGGCPIAWTVRSASRRWRRHWLASASRTSSTQTRAAGAVFTGTLIAAGIRHLDGWTRPLDRQRVHRTAVAEHEGINLKGYADGREAHAGIACWIAFCNRQRLHQALGNGTPMAVWREGTTGPPR